MGHLRTVGRAATVGLGVLLLTGGVVACGERESRLAADEVARLFPTPAWHDPGRGQWVCEVHGQVFEPEEDGLVRRAAIGALRRAIGLEKSGEDTELFRERARAFLVDNERGKRLRVRVGETEAVLGPSARNGHFSGRVRISDAVVARQSGADPVAGGGWLAAGVVAPADGGKSVGTRLLLLAPAGVSVVSDIDDTIKITGVGDEKEVLRNTFLRPYRAVDGIAAVYRQFDARGARFHYVSNSPWQLFGPLHDFATRDGFPEGTWHLRIFRAKDTSFWKFFTSGEEHKRETIGGLIERYPQREFVLVGDTGEKDPEIYGDLARRYGKRVRRILLRDPAGKADITPRLQTAMREIPQERWQVWADASDIGGVDTESEGE